MFIQGKWVNDSKNSEFCCILTCFVCIPSPSLHGSFKTSRLLVIGGGRTGLEPHLQSHKPRELSLFELSGNWFDLTQISQWWTLFWVSAANNQQQLFNMATAAAVIPVGANKKWAKKVKKNILGMRCQWGLWKTLIYFWCSRRPCT